MAFGYDAAQCDEIEAGIMAADDVQSQAIINLVEDNSPAVEFDTQFNPTTPTLS